MNGSRLTPAGVEWATEIYMQSKLPHLTSPYARSEIKSRFVTAYQSSTPIEPTSCQECSGAVLEIGNLELGVKGERGMNVDNGDVRG
ncbi:hypothetical protein IFR05_017412, partial [Cadophora sp. M221]